MSKKKENIVSAGLTLIIISLLMLSGNSDAYSTFDNCGYGYGYGYGYGNCDNGYGYGYGYGYGSIIEQPKIISSPTTNQGLRGSWTKLKEKVEDLKNVEVKVLPVFEEKKTEDKQLESITGSVTAEIAKEQTMSYNLFSTIGNFFKSIWNFIWRW